MEEDAPIHQFVKYLYDRSDVIRKISFRLVSVFIFLFIASFIFAKELFKVVELPLWEAMPNKQSALHFTGPMEVFLSYTKISFLIGALGVLPLFLVETWNLFKDKLGVYKSRAAIYAGCSFLLFGLGFVFCYFILLPTTMQYLIGLGEEVAKPIITVHDYVSLVVFMFLAMGLAFQAPIVLLVLEHLGLIERNMLAKNRRVVIVVILVIAAIVTPTPDPMSQIIMATPMYLLFEFALLLMKRN